MHLPLFIVFTFVVLGCSECGQAAWLQSKVDFFTDYARNVKNKIKSYLGFRNKTSTEYNINALRDNQARTQRKFPDHVEEAIAPEEERCHTTHFSTPQLIALQGYPSESHSVITDDGYILTVHRIPYSKNVSHNMVPRKTVLLHHGFLGSSANWIITGPNKGLAFILSEAGYDVWLANARGNTYSRAHVSRCIESFAFWNFTFHDISQHDLPAVIDYIMKVKGEDVKINYVGHSMGTTILFALLSTKPEYNKILRAGFALAPVAYMTKIKTPFRHLARFGDNIGYLMKLFGVNEYLPQNSVSLWLSEHSGGLSKAICGNQLVILCSQDEERFNKTVLPLILATVPAGASSKTLVHYAQEIANNGRFQQFDYGRDGNIKQYGSVIPPEYPVHKITLPIALFSAENDRLSSYVDVTNLYTKLVNPIEHYVVPLKEFSHNDFLWAEDAPTLVYSKLLQLLEADGNLPYSGTNTKSGFRVSQDNRSTRNSYRHLCKRSEDSDQQIIVRCGHETQDEYFHLLNTYLHSYKRFNLCYCKQ